MEIGSSDGLLEVVDCDVLLVKRMGHREGIYVVSEDDHMPLA
jgi:hypothetical protein